MIFKDYGDTGSRFINALSHMHIPEDALTELSKPKSVMKVALQICMDNGCQRIFEGIRVRYNDRRGPTKGGVRYHVGVSEAESIALAFRLMLKCAVADLPYGGAGGGIILNPDELSDSELERLSRAYVTALADLIGPDFDILSPDVNTDERIMAWMSDQFNLIHRHLAPAAVTGKPIGLGGCAGRTLATARGAIAVAEIVTAKLGRNFQDLSWAIQGFGNAGGNLATLLHEKGCRIIAVSDSCGALFSEDGLPIPEIIGWKNGGRKFLLEDMRESILKKSPMKFIKRDRLLELPVDVLVPAAMGQQVNKDNAHNVKAACVLELANGPTSVEGDAILAKKSIPVIPDLVANCGGVTASYFEWVQNRQGLYWSEGKVNDMLVERQQKLALEMLLIAEREGVSMATAAYMMGIKRLLASIPNGTMQDRTAK